MISAIITDIEGTTTAIDFVHKVLFPYSYENITEFVQAQQRDPEVTDALNKVFKTGLDENLIPDTSNFSVPLAIDLLKQFISEDRKHPGLKLIQGKIWKSGYESKAFISHIYPEVPEVLRYWKQRGLRLAVYSSGSVEAQKLLFSHTAYGDLTSLFSAFYDTKMGAKREKDAYQAICKDMGIDPQNVCFLSDVKEELDAAQKVGLKTIQLIRDEKVIIGSHPKAKNFSEVDQIINSALL